MVQKIDDWSLALGFDSSQVMKGISDIQKALNRLKLPNLSGNGRGGGGGGRGGGSSPAGSPLFQSIANKQAGLDVFKRSSISGLKEGSEAFKEITRITGDLQKQLNKVNSKGGLIDFNNNLRISRQRVKELAVAERDLIRTTNKANAAQKRFNDSLTHFATGFISVYAAIDIARTVFKAGKEMDSLKASMLAASDSATQAGDNMQFVKRSAKELGVELIAAGKGYTKIGAAAKSVGFDTKQTQEIFLAAAEASRTFGLNTDRTNLVFLAFSQIMSKGKVSRWISSIITWPRFAVMQSCY